MVSGVTFHRREPIRISAEGLLHPQEHLSATADHVPFLSSRMLQLRIATIAHHLAKDYRGKEFQLLVVLKGGKPFGDALAKELRKDGAQFSVHAVQLSSYQDRKSTGAVTLHGAMPKLANQPVLIVEDIIDTGLSLKFLIDLLHQKGLQEIGVCALFRKQLKNQQILPVQYLGFDIPDVFVVGFGMDCDEQYRELEYVAKMR